MSSVGATWTRKPSLGARVNPKHPLAKGLQASWLFNEGQGFYAYDSSGNDNTIALGFESSNGTFLEWTTGRMGGTAIRSKSTATSLAASGNIAKPIVSSADIAAAQTFECWVNLASGDTYGTLLAVSTNAGFWAHMSGSGYKFTYTTNTGDRETNMVLGFDVWYHLAAVLTSDGVSGTVRLFVNGRLDNMVSGFAAKSAQYLMAFNDTSSETLNGNVDLMRFWSRALSDEEVWQSYTKPFDMYAYRRRPVLFTTATAPVTATPARVKAQAAIPSIPSTSTPAQVKVAAAVPQIPRQSLPARVRAYTTIPLARVGGITATVDPPAVNWTANSLTTSFSQHAALTTVGVTWTANTLLATVNRTIGAGAAVKARTPAPRIIIPYVLRDCGDTYDAALAQPFIAGDVLIQSETIGLKLSFAYNPDDTWEHRIAHITPIEISAPPGGGLAIVGNFSFGVIEDGQGQSILELWESAINVEGVIVTVDFLLRGETSALRLFTGRIDTITVQDCISTINCVDASIQRDIQIPQTLVTTTDFPNADIQAIDQPQPLIYGYGSIIGGAPLLLIDTTTNTYLVAAHPMNLAGGLAAYNAQTGTYLPLNSVNQLTQHSSNTVTLGIINTATIGTLEQSQGIVDIANAFDGNSNTVALVGTANTDSNLDGVGYAGWTPGVPGYPFTTNAQLTLTNHRRAPASDPTVNGTFVVRTVDPASHGALRTLYTTEAYRHTSAQTDYIQLSNLDVGMNELLEVLLVARNDGGAGTASQAYQIGEISITPVQLFSYTASGILAAITSPFAVQDLRFNHVTHTLSVITASSVTNAAYAIDGITTTQAIVGTTGTDSNLDGIGELVVGASPTSAQRGNNTLIVNFYNHRRISGSDPTVTGQFNVLAQAHATGAIVRDNLFVTQQFRQTLNPLTTSYVVNSINLGRTAQIAIRLLARNEGGPGNALQAYEIGEFLLESYYQTDGDSGTLFLYGGNYSGRYDADGSVVSYCGLGAGTIFHTPDQVMASFLVQEMGLEVDAGSFANAYTFYTTMAYIFDGGIGGGGWAVQRASAREHLNALAMQARANLVPTFEGTFGLYPYRNDFEIQQSFDTSNILCTDGAEQQLPEERTSTFVVTLGNMQDVHTRFEVHYNYNVASGKYDKVYWVDETGTNVPSTATSINYGVMTGSCVASFNRYGKLEPFIVNAHWIADDTSAQLLLEHLVSYWTAQRIFVEFEAPLSALCLQVGGHITITHPSLPTLDNGLPYEVHTVRYMLQEGRVYIRASRPASIGVVLKTRTPPAVKAAIPREPLVEKQIAQQGATVLCQTPAAVINQVVIDEGWEFDLQYDLTFGWTENWSPYE